MREKKFMALVNLYLDEEISPRQLKALQHSIAISDERRRLFNAYKRMNWGIAVSSLEEKNVIPFQKKTSMEGSRFIYYAGLFTTAVAACVIFGISISKALFMESPILKNEEKGMSLAVHSKDAVKAPIVSGESDSQGEIPIKKGNISITASFETLVDYKPFQKKPSSLRLGESKDEGGGNIFDSIVYRPFNYTRSASNNIKNWNPGGVSLVKF